jgi:hypothetical protein
MFDHLKKFEGEATAEYAMPELGTDAKIEVRQASESNKHYFNALLRAAGNRPRQITAQKLDAKEVVKNRNEDRRLFAKYVIVGWSGVEDAGATPKEELNDDGTIRFTTDLAAELCEKLPGHLFDLLRHFAATVSNFYPEGEITPDGSALAEN